ncbi:MAG: hypothetical protein BGO14_04275 [Chlamydiales bacterium 38-26]|nr:NUDIX domain-containing protein [Chlamydiales bacterium]OJV07713.1 MAG: hypothetical protein BGO14_04275 [Chlamydiales bacterium 38-26]
MTTKQEHSYGIIPLKREGQSWNVLLVQLHAGHWGFPKGHPEPQETPLETATRELFEETGLGISQLLSEQTFDEKYFFKFQGTLIHKRVTYFIAEVNGLEKIMEDEVKAMQWVPLLEAVEHVTFDQAKQICRQVNQIVKAKCSRQF